MKSLRNYFIVTLLAFTIFSSCSKKPNKVIEKGTWYVSVYMDKNVVETSDFDGYLFDFGKDGTLTVTLNTGNVVKGTWTYSKSTSKFKISISGTDKLDKISREWLVFANTTTIIELKEGNSPDEDYLNFSKK